MIDVFSPSGREETEAQNSKPLIPEVSASSLSLQVLLTVAVRSRSLHVPLAVALLPVALGLCHVIRPNTLGYSTQR